MNCCIKSHVKEYREEYCMKQSELASAIGVSERTISTLESEIGCNPRGDTMLKLASYFEVPVEQLFELIQM